MTEFESEEILNKRYQPRNPKAPVEETVAARAAYEQAFNESTEGIPSAPNSILNRAVDLKNKYSDAIVSISENADGTWSLNVTTSDTQRYGKNGLPLGMYVDSEITQAKKSKFKNAQLVSEDGQRTKVNLQDLVQAGKRINETEGGTNFNEGGAATAAQAGLSTIMGQLLERGLRIEIDQLPLDHPSVNTETIVDASQNITLGQALQPRNTTPRGKYFYQAVDQEGNVYDQITIDPADDINDIRNSNEGLETGREKLLLLLDEIGLLEYPQKIKYKKRFLQKERLNGLQRTLFGKRICHLHNKTSSLVGPMKE